MTSKITVSGKIIEATIDKDYNTIIGRMASPRTSGIDDIVPFVAYALHKDTMTVGNWCTISGEIRTCNYLGKDEKHHKRMFVKVDEVASCEAGTDINEFVVLGTLVSKQPSRTTPLGKTITEFVVAYNNAIRSSYFNCIVWGYSKSKIISQYNVGDSIAVEGRFQSRAYQKDGEDKIAYELSCNEVIDVHSTGY